MAQSLFMAGDILKATYSWDDCRITHFYQVLKTTEKTLRLQELEVRFGGHFNSLSGTAFPIVGKFRGEPFTVRENKSGGYSVKLNTWGNELTRWDRMSAGDHYNMN